MARRLHRGASKRHRAANRPISHQPSGTVSLRAVCGVANPRNSRAIAAVSRAGGRPLASHPAKPLSRREEVVNTFLATLLTRHFRPGPFVQNGILGISPITRRFPAASPVRLHVLCTSGSTAFAKPTSQSSASRSLHRAHEQRRSPACKRSLTQDSQWAGPGLPRRLRCAVAAAAHRPGESAHRERLSAATP